MLLCEGEHIKQHKDGLLLTIFNSTHPLVRSGRADL
jgi:hypothetical protein